MFKYQQRKYFVFNFIELCTIWKLNNIFMTHFPKSMVSDPIRFLYSEFKRIRNSCFGKIYDLDLKEEENVLLASLKKNLKTFPFSWQLTTGPHSATRPPRSEKPYMVGVFMFLWNCIYPKRKFLYEMKLIYGTT